jgi:hypothetical protein
MGAVVIFSDGYSSRYIDIFSTTNDIYRFETDIVSLWQEHGNKLY